MEKAALLEEELEVLAVEFWDGKDLRAARISVCKETVYPHNSIIIYSPLCVSKSVYCVDKFRKTIMPIFA